MTTISEKLTYLIVRLFPSEWAAALLNPLMNITIRLILATLLTLAAIVLLIFLLSNGGAA
ncbi:MAG: hypothetical protein R3E95_06785 [Thiolinea sp.]